MAEKKATAETQDAPAAPGEETQLSKDAQHSSYAEVEPADADAYPPPGQQVEQTLGKPSEASE
jgi:hypothetical protein